MLQGATHVLEYMCSKFNVSRCPPTWLLALACFCIYATPRPCVVNRHQHPVTSHLESFRQFIPHLLVLPVCAAGGVYAGLEADARNLDIVMKTAKDGAQDAPNKMKAATDSPHGRAQEFLHKPAVTAALPFLNGGLAGMTATTCIQPIDMIKVRLQLAGEGIRTGPKSTPFSVAREVIASGRVLHLYTGLSAGLLRQVTYTTARLGIFNTLIKGLSKAAEAENKNVGFKDRAGAGLTAGGLAAMVGNPADLALIRIQCDGLKPPASRANYKSVIDALLRMTKTEGSTARWAGATSTVARAMALNFGQLAFFNESKTKLKETSLGPRTQTFTASAIAGFFASFFSLPFDFVKTRFQRQTRAADGTLPDNGMLDAYRKVTKKEGILSFYRGFSTYYVRIAPHAMITLIVADWPGIVTG